MLKLVFALRLIALMVFAAGTGLVVLTLGQLELAEAFSTAPPLPATKPARKATPVADTRPAASATASIPARDLQAPAADVAASLPAEAASVPAPPAVTTASFAPEAAPPQTGGVDLNTASLAELNGLRGAGAIGRAIIRGRPYRSIDELMSRRILSRARFEQVKGQVSVRL
ncbi:MAG: helix-hairpin-helix domain-containing protein [Methylobacterium sp.]|uniref:ComEA family DNA-binding protein n=1 Tax=Methylobacterium sp. TaxID=409 RepID=UPI00258BBB76|nr:helix-hairpin-helix domain-containing protein [Methylobacterium sp.]MBY0295028.1 helix-hairpin-helix domain-containing protein [Methylobacterium sp.]